VQFWTDGGPVSFEFIQPAAEDSPVRRTLESSGGLAHLCFEVGDIQAAVRDAESQGAIVVCAPHQRIRTSGTQRAQRFNMVGSNLIEPQGAPAGI
jgi:catechol 2,3-dioxygenase-like lactoylglutathione lyase family enzyme